jgi:hypothetical protein
MASVKIFSLVVRVRLSSTVPQQPKGMSMQVICMPWDVLTSQTLAKPIANTVKAQATEYVCRPFKSRCCLSIPNINAG